MNMRKLTLLLFCAACQLAGADERDKKPHVLNQWHPLPAEYKIHSRGTAYSEPPTKADSTFTVHFKGEAAKQLFDQLGPDVTDSCALEKGDRERRNKGAVCLYETRLDDPTDSHYRCWIGIDLRTGAGSARVSC